MFTHMSVCLTQHFVKLEEPVQQNRDNAANLVQDQHGDLILYIMQQETRTSY